MVKCAPTRTRLGDSAALQRSPLCTLVEHHAPHADFWRHLDTTAAPERPESAGTCRQMAGGGGKLQWQLRGKNQLQKQVKSGRREIEHSYREAELPSVPDTNMFMSLSKLQDRVSTCGKNKQMRQM